ncbi:VOC family protein [Actibacterium sp. MT2.3-13A]|uniref:VOC family protein n=1 Tax=Actibacterium sp. MT2.3-13A TaxID=2828332 RepID=UPI001BADBEC6|nr:VOC family protein [Actibacterium sp. MT2.3-13A]
MLELDHLAVSAATLEEGAHHVEEALGVTLAPGGRHELMGTHNRLLHLGPGLYLEVIAVDPEAPAPARPRWFDLDRFAGPPRLTNWIARCEALAQVLPRAPAGAGAALALSRGDLAWEMAVPADGRLPFDGAFPALIAWQQGAHPAARLPEADCRLIGLEVIHPQARALRAALAGLLNDPRVVISEGPQKALRATLRGPRGEVVLS